MKYKHNPYPKLPFHDNERRVSKRYVRCNDGKMMRIGKTRKVSPSLLAEQRKLMDKLRAEFKAHQ